MNTTHDTSYVLLDDEALARTASRNRRDIDELNGKLSELHAEARAISQELATRRLAKAADLPDRIDVNFTDADRENARARLIRHADGTYTIRDYNDEPGARHYADEESAYTSALGIENMRRITTELPAIFPLRAKVRLGAGAVEWEVVSRSDVTLWLENPATRNSWGNPNKRYVGLRDLNRVRRIDPA